MVENTEPSRPDDEERLPPVNKKRRAEARANLRRRFPEMTDEDFDEVGRAETRTEKIEKFIQKLIQKYKWSRGVCQQQLGMGLDDIRDC